MIRLTGKEKWGANASYINLDVFKSTPIINPKIRQAAKAIIGEPDRNTIGLCIRKEFMDDINSFVAIIIKVMTSQRNAQFYISSDSDEIVNEIAKKTSVNDRSGSSWTPVYPNYIDNQFSDEGKFLIDLVCLTNTNKIYSTANNEYAFRVASYAQNTLVFPNPNGAYSYGEMELVKM